MMLWITFVAVLPHKVPTEEVKLAAEINQMNETPTSLGHGDTVPQERKVEVIAAANITGLTFEADKLTYFLSELHFDQLNIDAALG